MEHQATASFLFKRLYSLAEIDEDFRISGFDEIKHSALDVSPDASAVIHSDYEDYLKSTEKCHALLIVAKRGAANSNLI